MINAGAYVTPSPTLGGYAMIYLLTVYATSSMLCAIALPILPVMMPRHMPTDMPCRCARHRTTLSGNDHSTMT